jgi:hypothetical protein
MLQYEIVCFHSNGAVTCYQGHGEAVQVDREAAIRDRLRTVVDDLASDCPITRIEIRRMLDSAL